MPFHLHQHLHRRQSGHHHDDGSGGSNGGNGQGASGTFVSIVYVTASQTFTGPVAGFTTIGVAASPSSQSAAAPAPSSNSPQVIVPPESSAAPASIAPSPALSLGAATTQTQSSTPTPAPSTSLLKSIKTHDDHTSTSSLSPEVVASQTTPASLTSASVSVAAAAAAAATTTPASTTVTNNDSSNSGLSAGAKAGIAIGVILCVLALAAGAFALYRSRKRRNEEAHAEAQNEKNPFADPGAAAAPTKRGMVQSQAPVLPPMGLAAAAPAHDVEKRAESPVNPFGPGAETIRETQSSAGPTAGPNVTDTDKIALGASAAGAAAGIATAAAAKRTSLPAPLKISRTQSPALVMPGAASPAASNFSEVSMATAASGAAPGPGSKMHRVQMDFTPTMDDELQIRAGEIVEVMHEYDDGWCLSKIVRRSKEGASRVDRGVVPRTCLSRLPLKPRNNGQKRQAPPSAGAPRPESSASGPAALMSSTAPRSNSPALNAIPAKRSVSPGPYGGGPQTKPQSPLARSRSNSMSDLKQARKDAPGPSALSKEARDIQLPIQIPAAELPSTSGSVPASPMTRKPLPTKKD